MNKKLRVLHLSDFHFRKNQHWDTRATMTALLEHLKKLRDDEDLRPDFVCLTGDLAFSGQRDEFDHAERFCRQLAETLDLTLHQHFFVIPGNHDIDRGKIGRFDEMALAALQSSADVEDLFADVDAMAGLVGRRLEAFYDFTARLYKGGEARVWHAKTPWRVDVRDLDGLRVGFLQLNSAWTSGKDDETHKLVLGEAQLREALQMAEDALVKIALVHHPLDHLREWDRQRVEGLLGAPGGIHLLLRGHLHRGRSEARQSPDGKYVELAAGAADVGRGPRSDPFKHFFLITLDLGAGETEVRSYRYSSEGRGFWAADTLSYEQAPQGIWSFDLPASLHLGAGDSTGADDSTGAGDSTDVEVTPEVSEARRKSLTARYRDAVAAVHGTVRFVGFGDSSPRPNVDVAQLFVPLRLVRKSKSENQSQQEEKIDLSTHDLLSKLTQADGDPARFVVLGDPGSGKTTLCRFLASVLAGAVKSVEVEALRRGAEPLPLFLPFRDYVRAQRKDDSLSLVAFLHQQASGHLQVPLPEGFLEAALQQGKAVLLLDGMDEVGSVEEREEMRERVLAFRWQYERVPIVVTSRIAGYDQAPLKARSFQHLQLEAFSDEDLDRFVRNWYRLVEVDDLKAQDEGTAELLAAFETDPRVQELARNPMLATLIALVHRYEAHLPGERAKLYELCVKTLLETWPAARRRRFVEIDEGLQRVYLERLALRMQERRAEGERELWKGEEDTGEITIEKGRLLNALTEIVCEARGQETEKEVTRRLVERWVSFLEEGTGLLVEQQPGVFAFFHLSLLEYLAARGLEQRASEGGKELAEEVAEHYDDARWREVCLLAVGAHAVDKGFLDALFEALADQSGRWSFLLAGLREEAAFDAGQRTAILAGVGQELLDRPVSTWEREQRLLDELLRFSRRHKKAVQEWLQQQLQHAEGSALQGVVALRFQGAPAVLEQLRQRPQLAPAAEVLLDFWPHDLGRWAISVASPELRLRWGRGMAPELAVWRALMALSLDTGGEALQAALVPAVVRGAAEARAGLVRGIERLRGEPREGGQGVPAGVCLRSAEVELELAAAPAWPAAAGGGPEPDFAGYFARAFAGSLAGYFAEACAGYFARDFARAFAGYLARDPAVFFTGYFAGSFARAFAGYFAGDFARDFARGFARGFASYFAGYFAGCFAGDVAGSFSGDVAGSFSLESLGDVRHRLDEPRSRFLSEDLEVREAARGDAKDAAAQRYARVTLARLGSEAWLAFVSTHGAEEDERLACIHRCVTNYWLLSVWPGGGDLCAETQQKSSWTDDATALYLALGWTQATTTHQWPATDAWIEQVSQRPDHWFPRSQWHLCYLLHNPDDSEHQEGYRQALAEGESDAERPGLSGMLRELVPG